MSDERGLLKAVIADPEGDTPRLVYADWLQEHDRAEEGELIRVQCHLEASPPDHPDYAEWRTREEELKLWLAGHTIRPAPRFPAGLRVSGGRELWPRTRRGFARFLEFDGHAYSGLRPMRELAKALERAFAVLPTRWLVVRFVTVEQLAELLRQPVVGGLDSLTVQLPITDDPQNGAARVLAECPGLRDLRALFLIFPIGDEGAAALARSEHLARLESLRLDQCMWCTAAAVRSLGSSSWFRGLRSLDLGELNAPAFEELCRLDPIPRLHTLELSGNSFPLSAWQAFARSEVFPRLTRLLNHTGMDEGQMAALAGAEWFRPAVLDLTGQSMGNRGAGELAAAPWLGSLRWLGLRANSLGPSGFAAVAGSRNLAGLEHLELSYNAPGLRGLRVLARNPALRGLKVLTLKGDEHTNRDLTQSHLREFLTQLDLPRLRHLDLSGRPVGGRAARLLAGEKFGTLTRLDLSECQLTDAAVAGLVTAPALQNLVELNVSGNKLNEGLKPLAERANLPRLGAGWVHLNDASAELKKVLRRRSVLGV